MALSTLDSSSNHALVTEEQPGEQVATIPVVLARGPAIHTLVRVELTNGSIITGRLVAMDPQTMNLKLDGIVEVAVRRVSSSGTSADQKSSQWLDPEPVGLRCLRTIIVRGSHVQFLDFLSEAEEGGRGLESIREAVENVSPV